MLPGRGHLVSSVGPVGWSLDGCTFVGSAGAGFSEAPGAGRVVAGVDNERSRPLPDTEGSIPSSLKPYEVVTNISIVQMYTEPLRG